jgi:hypothetical protein
MFNIITCLRHVSNIQVFILRKTCTCSFVVISSKHPYKQSGRWKDVLDTQYTIIKLKINVKSVHFFGSYYVGTSLYRLKHYGRRTGKKSPEFGRILALWVKQRTATAGLILRNVCNYLPVDTE